MSNDNSGAAFPMPVAVSPAGDVHYSEPGMSLRDYFAGQALAGVWASPRIIDMLNDSCSTGKGIEQHVSMFSYHVADRMLAERSKGGE